MVNPDVGGWQK